MKETEIPLVKLLMREDLKARYNDEGVSTRLLFY
jgi:hypothetical protein